MSFYLLPTAHHAPSSAPRAIDAARLIGDAIDPFLFDPTMVCAAIALAWFLVVVLFPAEAA